MNIVSVTQDIFLRFVREVDFWLEVKEFVTSFEVVGEEEEAAWWMFALPSSYPEWR